MRYDPVAPWDLRLVWIASFGSFVLAFPLATLAVFSLGADRSVTADVISVVCSFGIFIGCGAALAPLPGLRGWSRQQRLRAVVLPFTILSYTTHLTWELAWLLLHERIAQSRSAAWAYPWWAYIDGGDMRYADPASDFLVIEMLSVANGTIGMLGLLLLFRSEFRDRRGVLLCMATAVVHLYSASWYFGSEIVAGLPNVNTESFLDTWIKFGLLNAPWLVFPWFVLRWGYGALFESTNVGCDR